MIFAAPPIPDWEPEDGVPSEIRDIIFAIACIFAVTLLAVFCALTLL